MRASMLTMLGLSSLLLLVALMQPEPPSAPRPFREPVKREVLKNIWRAIFQRRG